jgi:hypothetical protein
MHKAKLKGAVFWRELDVSEEYIDLIFRIEE